MTAAGLASKRAWLAVIIVSPFVKRICLPPTPIIDLPRSACLLLPPIVAPGRTVLKVFTPTTKSLRERSPTNKMIPASKAVSSPTASSKQTLNRRYSEWMNSWGYKSAHSVTRKAFPAKRSGELTRFYSILFLFFFFYFFFLQFLLSPISRSLSFLVLLFLLSFSFVFSLFILCPFLPPPFLLLSFLFFFSSSSLLF